jgi:hypothetical protein
MTLKRYILPIILVFLVVSCSDGGSSTTFSSGVSTDSAGNFLWVQAFGGGADDIGWDMSVDSTGQVFVAGEYAGLVDFDPSAGEDNHTRWARLTFSSQMALPTHS